MGRYSRNTSTYIQRKKHQNIEGGSIIERDWTTLGERHVIEPGKRKVYSDGGLLFTESNRPGIKKRNKTNPWSDAYTIDDLSLTINSEVNAIKLPVSPDIRSYAYYGSAVELLRATIENILKWFPGKLWATDALVADYPENDDVSDAAVWEIVDIIYHCALKNYKTYNVTLTTQDERLKDGFLLVLGSKEKTTFELDDDTFVLDVSPNDVLDILTDSGRKAKRNIQDAINNNYTDSRVLFSITSNDKDGDKRKFYLEFVNNSDIDYNVDQPKIHQIENPFNLDLFRTGVSFGKDDNELRNVPYSLNSYYINGRQILSYDIWINPQQKCVDDYTVLYDITFTYTIGPKVSRFSEFYPDYNADFDCFKITTTTDKEELEGEACLDIVETYETYYTGHIYGLSYQGEIIWCTDVDGLTLVPTPNVLYNYFNSLDGFERVLLTRKSNPIYTSKLLTPYQIANTPYYKLAYSDYTFPSDGYCIICTGSSYNGYVNSLYDMASIMDEEYSDNIWRNMTHESIKNFDWTYRREFDEGEEVDNVFGGTRLKDMLRIYGRFFDDIKRYIDGISLANVITYEGVNNIPSAQLSDKAQLTGWEVYSTKLNNDDNINFDSSFVENIITKKTSRWGPSVIGDDIIFPCDEQPKWFTETTPESTTQNTVDNNFMRMLTMCGPSIFRSKGTKHAIEMVAALFGLGEDDIEYTEKYYKVTPHDAYESVFVYIPQTYVVYPEQYKDVETDEINSLTKYVSTFANQLTKDNEPYITIGGEYYNLTEYSYQGLCKEINKLKTYKPNYEDDDYSGVPIKVVKIKGKRYVVPYFTQDKIYDGDVQFESNGGWGKWLDDNDNTNKRGYSETLPYTQVVQNCNGLLEINRFSVNEKVLYYVMDLSDILYFTKGTDTKYISHYFKLIDPDNPQLHASWSNVPILDDNDDMDAYNDWCNEVDEDTELPLRPLFASVNHDDYELMQYLETIKFDNLGNNPHGGYGRYDVGANYLNHLRRPFYYNMNYYGFDKEYVKLMADRIRFEVKIVYDRKIVINNNDIDEETNMPIYYLPSKYLNMKLTGYSDVYYEYFKKVIFKYLSQVIPSTTILTISI